MNGTLEQLKDVVEKCGVTIDALWCSQGWSATDPVVAAISVEIGKAINIVHELSVHRVQKINKGKEDDEVSILEFLTWFAQHEPECYQDNEGSCAVSRFFLLNKLYYCLSSDFGLL